MIIGVLQEPNFETRTSLLPEAVALLVKKGHTLLVEPGAGTRARANDSDYQAAGAALTGRQQIFSQAAIMLAIQPPGDLPQQAPPCGVLLGVYQPLFQPALMQQWALAGFTVFSLDLLPRTTRAQAMDVLSSQANIAGYKAVLLAAHVYPRYFPMLMTAAGSIAPARILILGAGVAGLQAIATARRLGAVVEVFDTRPAVKEEVMSLGGKFIEVEGAADPSAAGGYAVEQSAEFMSRQKEKIAQSIAKADIVICTAQIPGKRAPVLVTASMIAAMRKGSVIVDLAAATGGNTELTVNDQTREENGVTIIGDSALAAAMPSDASKLYGKNLLQFLQLLTAADGSLQLNWADDLVKGACITHGGAVVHERVKSLL